MIHTGLRRYGNETSIYGILLYTILTTQPLSHQVDAEFTDYKMPLPLMLQHARWSTVGSAGANASAELFLTSTDTQMHLVGYSTALQHFLLRSTSGEVCLIL